jgi:hypothetical protein
MAENLPNTDELLIRYLDKDLSKEEEQQLEQQLLTDPVLREKLERLKLATLAIKQFGQDEEIRAIHRQMMQEKMHAKKPGKLVSMNRAVRYSMAAAASIILLFVLFRVYEFSQVSSDKLYKEAYVDYQYSAARGQQVFSAVAANYAANNFTGVIDAANANQLGSAQDSLLTGISYLKLNDAPHAIRWLELMSNGKNFQQDAQFYLALAYLKNKSYDKSVALMEKIHADNNHPYHDRFSENYINKVSHLKP